MNSYRKPTSEELIEAGDIVQTLGGSSFRFIELKGFDQASVKDMNSSINFTYTVHLPLTLSLKLMKKR